VQAVFDTITNLLSEEVVKKTNAIFSFTLKGIFRLVEILLIMVAAIIREIVPSPY
jgi:hypothetical protein